ncbi:Cell division protein FtsL [Rubrobacter xylanophilus DSM 9941]|uniref:cell division protein FtsL n=1 Tax=Rubrobacter xylanophilus TaxID=49319 RepID=UPI001C63BA15|nr:cell division protein FtsL [Rubrobacter xylanophilus]QYJ14734.1 Cell division protein FtsL [Rubrobacter xylanophilus DSM 9941]
MALPRYREYPVAAPQPRVPAGRSRRAAARRRAAERRRRFLLLVVVPVLLMLGSVYLHAVASDLSRQQASLQERIHDVRSEGEELRLRAARLSRPERVVSLAREELGMRTPTGNEMRVYGGSIGEDGIYGEDNRTEEDLR